jgi:hypothetical protein
VGTEKRREKVVVLRQLQRAIIYTRELSKQAIEDHVSTAFIVYSVNESARLTQNVVVPSDRDTKTQESDCANASRESAAPMNMWFSSQVSLLMLAVAVSFSHDELTRFPSPKANIDHIVLCR